MNKEERDRMWNAAPFLGEVGCVELRRCLDRIEVLQDAAAAVINTGREIDLDYTTVGIVPLRYLAVVIGTELRSDDQFDGDQHD